MKTRYWFLGMFAAFAFAACGHNGGSTDANGGGGDDGGGGGDDGGGGGDGDGGLLDSGSFGGMCSPISGAPQCSNCVDDDGDMKVDGFDPECTGPADRLEDSFATGIPGDNIDSTMQDCFFDGNSGAGNDGCNQHVCCLLHVGTTSNTSAMNKQLCHLAAPDADENKYNIAECYQPFGTVPVPMKCKDNCGKLTAPGCDCFGCCTICDANGCASVLTNPNVSPNCNDTNISDKGLDGIDNTGDEPCKRCTATDCGMTACAYDGVSCTPCPGQCDSNGTCNPPLPAACNMMTSCPTGYVACDSMGACPQGSYCQSGCCTGAIIL